MTDRERFEAFISGPPFEKPIDRIPEGRPYYWPGQYRNYSVQLAWEAWKAALESRHTPSDAPHGDFVSD